MYWCWWGSFVVEWKQVLVETKFSSERLNLYSLMSSAAIDRHMASAPLPRAHKHPSTREVTSCVSSDGWSPGKHARNNGAAETRESKEEEETEGWVKTLRHREREGDHLLLLGNNNREMGGRRIRLGGGGGVMYSVLSAPLHTHTHNSVFTYHPWTYSPSSTILWHFPIEVHSHSITKPQRSHSAAQVPPQTSSYHNRWLRTHQHW